MKKNTTHFNSHLPKPWFDLVGAMPSGELLRAEGRTFHPTPIRRDPREAHGVVLAVVRACCVALDVYPGSGPPQCLDRLVLFGELRRHGSMYIRAQVVEMAVDRRRVGYLLGERGRAASEEPLKSRSCAHAVRPIVDGAHGGVAPVLLLLLSLTERAVH